MRRRSLLKALLGIAAATAAVAIAKEATKKTEPSIAKFRQLGMTTCINNQISYLPGYPYQWIYTGVPMSNMTGSITTTLHSNVFTNNYEPVIFGGGDSIQCPLAY